MITDRYADDNRQSIDVTFCKILFRLGLCHVWLLVFLKIRAVKFINYVGYIYQQYTIFYYKNNFGMYLFIFLSRKNPICFRFENKCLHVFIAKTG